MGLGMNLFKEIVFFPLTVTAAFLNIVSALSPKPPTPKPADITDFDAPTADEGRPIPVVFGTVKIKGPNVLWYGGLTIEAVTKKGGKK